MNHLIYVRNLMRFAFRANRLLYVSIAVSIFSAVIELLAMSSLLPLFELASGQTPAADGLIARVLTFLGMAVSVTAFLWAFLVLFAIRLISQLIGQSLSMYLGRKVLAQLCSGAFSNIIHTLPIQEVNAKSIGFYISLAGDEAFRASTLVISLSQFASTALLALLYYVAIANYSLPTATFILVFALGSIVVLYQITKISHRLGARQTEESRGSSAVFLDSLNNIKAVRAFSAERYVADVHRSLIFQYAKTLFWIDEVALLTRLTPILILLFIFGVWLLWSAPRIAAANLAFIVTMIIYLMRFFPTVGQGIGLLIRIASDAKSGRDVTTILETQSTAQTNNRTTRLSAIEQIKLQDVSFSFDLNKKKEILKNVNLTLEKGHSYALVGRSGVGKSTLVDLLLRFYLPTSGRLYLNDVPISDVTDAQIRERIILVGQESAIFDDTVINNILLGMTATLSEVKEACIAAGIHEVIEEMPGGYGARLQYQGKNLSGGQRQRIAIARALLRKPEVLILDESTSALDKQMQELVIDNILKKYSEKIVIFVTHDSQIMERVDRIVRLSELNRTLMPSSASA